ncbi:hypothetical protein C0Q70_15884 [Pomacea canaliculata]|uniref:Uncharacterized protein n=1 Tax=Pomacea canaliculata TaxID=400727 RepID=A0A2T7NW56_POMCA|nr:hypothetical protein C0Q70_15884 [Pomacea canaliculata]
MGQAVQQFLGHNQRLSVSSWVPHHPPDSPTRRCTPQASPSDCLAWQQQRRGEQLLRSPPWRQLPRFVRSGGTSERQQAAAVGSTAQHSTAPTPRHGTAVLRLLQRVCLRLTAATRAADGGGREAQLVEVTLGNSPSVPLATTPSAGVWRARCWLCSDYSPLRGGTNLL